MIPKRKKIYGLIVLLIIVTVSYMIYFKKDVREFSEWDLLYGDKLFNVPVWDVKGEILFSSVKKENEWHVTNLAGRNRYVMTVNDEQSKNPPKKGQRIRFEGKVMHLGAGGFIFEVNSLEKLP